ncbi:hypothetical protein VNI00_019175, partial [Paramarasmius palmivorus]
MPTPIRNPFAPPPAPQPKPRKLKTKREERSLGEMFLWIKSDEQQLAMYERAKALVKAFLYITTCLREGSPSSSPPNIRCANSWWLRGTTS